MTIIRPTTINARFSQPVGLGGEKLWLCPTLGGDRLDLSGNGNHGTYNGGMGTVVDKYKGSRAYEFDGSNDYINLGSVLTGTGDFTISAWFYTNSTSYSYIYGKGVEGPRSDGIGISQQGSFYGAIGNNSTRIVLQNSGSVSTATWYHYAVTFDRDGVATKYVNGMPIGSESIVGAAGNIGSDNDYIGRFGSTTAGFFNGKIDDVRAYNRVLNPSEIKHLASKRGVLGSPRKPYDPFKRTVVRVPAVTPSATKVGSFKKPTTISKPSYQAGYARNASESENPKLWDGLVGAWMPSLGVTGETLRDVSGNGNHGTLTNMDAASDWVATSKGLALDFDGSGDDILIDAGDKLSPNPKEITLSTKIEPRSFSNAYNSIISYDSGRSSVLVFLLAVKSNGKLACYVGRSGGYTFYDGSGLHTLQSGKAYSVSMSHGKRGLYCFVNGVLDKSVSFAGDANVGSVTYRISGQQGYSDRYFNGKNFAAMVHSRQLSPQEIKHLHVDSLAPFRKKKRVSVAVPAAVTPSATYHPLRSLAHPLEQ